MKLLLSSLFRNVSHYFTPNNMSSSNAAAAAEIVLEGGLGQSHNGTSSVLHLESPLGRMSRMGWEWFLYLWSLLAPYITTPVLVLFIFPFVICLGIYLSALLLYVYRLDVTILIRRLRTVVLHERDLLKAGREMVSTLWDAHVSTGTRTCTGPTTQSKFSLIWVPGLDLARLRRPRPGEHSERGPGADPLLPRRSARGLLLLRGQGAPA